MRLFYTFATLSILLLTTVNLAKARDGIRYKSAEILYKYKKFLIEGTYVNDDWSSFKQKPKSRYHTFKKAFEHLEKTGGKVVVELGTTRSFTHGGLPGCNQDNPIYWTPNSPENWDWGAGSFTRMAAECLAHLNPHIYTIDLAPQHINRCKIITHDFRNSISYYTGSSVDFLRRCDLKNKINLLYMDTGDMTPIEPTALLQLEEAKIIVERQLIAPNGLILIDDVRNQTPKKFGETSEYGKAKYSLAYLLKNGFEIVADEYQVILKRVS